MSEKNASEEHPQTSEEGNPRIFIVLVVVIVLSVLIVISKGQVYFKENRS